METSLVDTTSRKISGHWYLEDGECVAQGADLRAVRRRERVWERVVRKSASLPDHPILNSNLRQERGG